MFAGQGNIAHTAKVQLECLFLQQFKNESIARVDISYAGKHLLAGSTVEKIRYWNIKKNKSPIETSFESELVALNFITKDNHIFFANRIGTTRIFTNRLSKKLTEYRFPKTSRFSSIGNNADLIAYGENIYYPAQDRLLSSTVGHAAQSALQVGRQKYVLTSGFHDERVVVRDPGGNIIAAWKLDEPALTAAMSKDSKFIAASTQKKCYVWRIANSKASHSCNIPELVNAIHISKTINLLVLVMNNSISAYRLSPFKKLIAKQINGNIRSSALSKNNWLSIGLDNGSVQLWDILQGKLLSAVPPSKKRITSIDINQATKLLLVGSYDGIVALYKIKK